MKCVNCSGPAHEATGWILYRDPVVILCGPCAKRFSLWYKARTRNPLTADNYRDRGQVLDVEDKSNES